MIKCDSAVAAESGADGPASGSEDGGADADLVKLVLAGQREVFGTLARRYERPLYGHLYCMTRNTEVAEDLAQEALLRAYRKLASYRLEVPFKRWLLRIATNLALDDFRRGKRERDALAGGGDLLTRGSTFEDELLKLQSADDRRVIAGALTQLPPQDVAVLNLHYHERLRVSEIAEIVDKSPGAVKVMLHRTRKKLKELLTKMEQDGKR
jgi:RNA polymerase sigma-70 factor, ECF subfamily